MRKWITPLLVISIIVNINLFLYIWMTSFYTFKEQDKRILGEMTVKVLESEEFQQIADSEKEKIYAIESGVDRWKGGVFPYHYSVTLRTNKESYDFYCADAACNKVEIGGWSYSRYSGNQPTLPLKNKE